MKYVIQIQSYSDIITNSSSELFVVANANKEIKELLIKIFTEESKSDNWGYSGNAGEWYIYTLEDKYTEPKEYEDVVYIDNPSDSQWSFIKDIINGRDSAKISEFTLDQFVKIESLTDGMEYTKDSLFIDTDWKNSDFVTSLGEKYNLELISVDI